MLKLIVMSLFISLLNFSNNFITCSKMNSNDSENSYFKLRIDFKNDNK